jgi:hypothetical protein
MGATVDNGGAAEAARELAVRLTEFFAQSGWDAVADPIVDESAGSPSVEIRSAEPLGTIPGRFAPHRARWPVEAERLDAQFSELCALLKAARVAPASGRAFTTQPVLPAWCLAE